MALTKTEIADHLAKTQNLTKAAATELTNTFFGLISDSLENGNEVAIAGFGNFKLTKKPAKTGRNPRTGEAIEIAARTSVSFKAGKALKDALKA